MPVELLETSPCPEAESQLILWLAILLRTTLTMPVTPLPHLSAEYDESADTLYLQWGDEPTTHGLEVRPGIIARLTANEAVEGLTLYDVSRYFAFDPRQDLSPQSAALLAVLLTDILPEHLHVRE